MSTTVEIGSIAETHCPDPRPNTSKSKKSSAALFGYPRDFLENRFVYLTISPRARGLSIGINLTPSAKCNFDCLYCDVDRTRPRREVAIDCDVAAKELERMLETVQSGELRLHSPYSTLPEELLRLRHVALSGDGEPTECPKFLDMVETAVHVRARGKYPFFKLVMITNASCLDVAQVQESLTLFTAKDEIWAKLDAGTEEYMREINRSSVPLQKILTNILNTAKKRPVIIQSLFSAVDGVAPSTTEIAAYAERLRELRAAGANIPLVQIYSATRPRATTRVEHLPLRAMADIAATVRSVAGLKVEVF